MISFEPHDLLPGVYRWYCNGRLGDVKAPVTDEMIESIRRMASYDPAESERKRLAAIEEFERITGTKFIP